MPNLSSPPRPCRELEQLILESLDAADSPPRPGLEEHLAACPACRGFRRQQQEIDALLRSSLQPASLPATFKEQLLARVQVCSAQPEPEPDLAHQDLSRCSGAGFTVRDALGSVMGSVHWVAFVASLSLLVFLAVTLSPGSPAVPLRQEDWFSPGLGWFLGWAALAIGLAVGFKERFRRMWEWI